MRKTLSIIFLTFCSNAIYAQSIVVNPKNSTVPAKRVNGSDLVIPIELDFINSTSAPLTKIFKIKIDTATSPMVSHFNTADIANVKILNNDQEIVFKANETKKATNTFYLFIDKAISIDCEKIVHLKINDGVDTFYTIKVTIQPDDKELLLADYLKKGNRLDYVTKVESNNNILTVGGYKKIITNDGKKHDVFIKKNVELKRGKVLAIHEWSCIFDVFHWKPVPLTLTTIPLKVRPKITSYGKEFNNTATSGITNIGLNLDLWKYQIDRYFSTAKKSTHKFSLGLWASPSVEELDSIYTSGANGVLGKALGKLEKSKQFFVSAGLTISYSYNDISFVIVPGAWDFGTSAVGKTWVYDKRRWWGFGIAVSPKIFATILNKP